MAFTLSGDTIIQTGIETDLSGLSGISGVTKLDCGTDSGVDDGNTSLKKIYFTNNRKLEIKGTLEIDPLRNILIMGKDCPRLCVDIFPGSTLRLGKLITINNTEYYNDMAALEIYNSGLSDNYANSFRVQNGGSLEILGCSLKQRGRMEVYGLLKSRDGTIFNGNDTNWGIIRLENGATTDVDGLKVVGGTNAMTFIAKPSDGTFVGFQPIGNSGTAIDMSGNSPNNSFYEFKNYSGIGNTYDFPIYSDTYGKFINSKNGTNLSINESTSGGLLEVRKELSVNLSNKSGNPISDAICAIKDYNNGNRVNKSSEIYINDFLYIQEDINSIISNLTVLTGVYVDTNGWDYRSKNNSNDDVFDINIFSYLYEKDIFSESLKGIETLEISRQLTEDSYISEQNIEIVKLYSEINNANELYDYCKYLKTISPTVTYPSLNTMYIDGVSKSLKISPSWSMTRDQTILKPVEIDSINKIIKVKTGINGLESTDKFDTIIGNIDSLFDGHIKMQYLKSNGTVDIEINELNPENFVLSSGYPANILYRINGQTIWNRVSTHTLNSEKIEVLPNTEYEISIRVPGYEWRTFLQNSGDYGEKLNSLLVSYKDLDGNNIFSKSANESIISTFSYDNVNNLIKQTNTTGNLLTVSFNDAFIGIQRIENNPQLVGLLDIALIPNNERNGFLVEESSSINFVLTDNSNDNVQLMFNIATIVDGIPIIQISRFRGNQSGYYILMASEIVNFSSTFPTTEENANAVKQILISDFNEIEQKMDTKPTLSDIEDSNIISKRDMVYIDTLSTTNGIGTFESPFNNVSDGLDEVINNNYKKVYFNNNAELDREIHHLKIYGCNYPVITNADGMRNYKCCEFYGVTLHGFFDEIKAIDCNIEESSNLWGSYINCGFNGTMSCASSKYVRMINCYDLTNQTSPNFDFITLNNVQNDFELTITGYDGTTGISNCDNATASISIHTDGGRVVLGSTLDEGTIHLYGSYNLVNSMSPSTNATLIEEGRVASHLDVEAIKSQTDRLQFTVDDDIKATLDNEQVDIGKVNTVAVTDITDFKTDISQVESDTTAIKTKTDNLPIDTTQKLIDIENEATSAKLWAIKATKNTQKS